MKVVTSRETAGFCFGVQEGSGQGLSADQSRNVAPIYTLGPIIHNEGVVADLAARRSPGDLRRYDHLETIQQGTVVIRSHGVGQNVYDQHLESTGPGLCRCHLSLCTQDPPHRRTREHWQDTADPDHWRSRIIRKCRGSAAGAMVLILFWPAEKKQKTLSLWMEKKYVSYLRRHLITTNLKN